MSQNHIFTLHQRILNLVIMIFHHLYERMICVSGIGNEIGEAIKGAIPKSVDKAMENLTDKPTKTLGDFVESLVYIACGGVIHLVEKKKLVHAYKLEQFKVDLKARVNSIPKEKLIEPSTQIIMGALTDAQYCVEDEVLRSMFSNLIASSVNADLNKNVHPSFSGIIRQMTALDAQNLLLFAYDNWKPIVKFVLDVEPYGVKPIHELVFLDNPDVQDVFAQATSIFSLAAFGLVTIDFVNSLTPESKYDGFSNVKEYEEMQHFVDEHTVWEEDGTRTVGRSIGRGLVSITSRGRQFLRVCFSQDIP